MSVVISEYLFIEPDWESAFQYKRIWKTSIQTTIEEGEKRSALFTWPRRYMKFSINTMTLAETNLLVRKLHKSLHLVYGIPFWPEGQQLTTEATSGQNELEITTTEKSNFELGGKCVILEPDGSYEVCEVFSMTSTVITVSDNLNSTWSEGTYVYPILKGSMKAEQSLTKPTDGYASFTLEVDEVPDTDITHIPFTSASFPTYQSIPIFNITPNWISELSLNFKHNYDMIQYLGVRFANSLVSETNLKMSGSYLTTDLDEFYEILAFFDDRKGRWDSFWVSTDAPDITLTAASAWDATTLSTEDIQWSTYWSDTETETFGQYVEFSFPNGYKVQRKILSATSADITLDAATGVTITSAMLPYMKVSFLMYARFDTDEIEAARETDTVADFVLRFTSIYEAITYVASTPPASEYIL